MKTSVLHDLPATQLARLLEAHNARQTTQAAVRRQPVHVLYGGAHLFRANTSVRLGELARDAFSLYAPSVERISDILGLPNRALTERVYTRVQEKLTREPIEDLRIDFEDGYGNRADAEEDQHAQAAAQELASGLTQGTLPPFMGIRIKALTPELHLRALRTLDLFVTTLLAASGGELPGNFCVTLPKVTLPEEVALLSAVLEALEARHGLARGVIKIELMVETPQALVATDGSLALRKLVLAGQNRVTGAHMGSYDYTAALDITAAHQSLTHAACDFAKHVMKLSLADTGVFLSDGATTTLPIGPHKGALSPEQAAENLHIVERAWRMHYANIRYGLVNGFYQGWDLHPAQLPMRYFALYQFFLESLEPAAKRLRGFIEGAAQATRQGQVFDDAATGQGLLNYFLRAESAGALTADEVQQHTGLTLAEIATRSFLAILKNRAQEPR